MLRPGVYGESALPVLNVADIGLNPATRLVRRSHTEVPLAPKEFQLLEVFMRHPDQVLSRYQLLEGGFDTVRGVGYGLRSG